MAFGNLIERSTWVDHPSGYIALNAQNALFELDGLAGFIAYREQGKHLVVFGGVHAPVENWEPLLAAFSRHARQRRKRLMVVQLREPQVALFASRGFTINQFGTSFAIGLDDYSWSGTSKMQLRNKIKRAQRAGLRVSEVGREFPRNGDTFAKLNAISDAWLAAKKKKELDFMIGQLGGPEATDRRIFVVLNKADEICAFITYVPVWGERPGYLHDLTRRTPDAETGAMELCNSVAIDRMRTERVRFLHFGFTPFYVKGAELPHASRAFRWLLDKLLAYGQMLYPAASQVAYKMKWGPSVQESEYVAVQPLSLRAIWDFMVLTRSL